MVTVRPATVADAASLAALDVRYVENERFLRLTRSGTPPELTFTLRWERGEPVEREYGPYPEDRVRGALAMTDLFLLAELDGRTAGLLMVVVPGWTDAGEITDLVVDRAARRRGVGRALVGAATAWARKRELRACWAEPNAGNAEAIEFYLSLGFRLSGVNDRWSTNEDVDGKATVYLYLELR